ncbi:MAG: hypothetical protein CMM46_15190 [Rhodospirillaceae bacterium]|nr:hypothetical protein [Rhodospirillaceae bacterium]|tara:strand:- start:7139 stop:7591 length:453 start_codon:yes stop_codon:yes gene_type:complete
MADPDFTLSWHDGCDPAFSEAVLRDLPDWFGIEKALKGYIEAAVALPTVLVHAGNEAIGFASLTRESEATHDIHVIDVKAAFHRTGAGRALIGALAERARQDGASLLTVKTLSSTHRDPFYGRTRRFYEAMGFLPAAELSTLWGPTIPAC